jgi:hypothetical protein
MLIFCSGYGACQFTAAAVDWLLGVQGVNAQNEWRMLTSFNYIMQTSGARDNSIPWTTG